MEALPIDAEDFSAPWLSSVLGADVASVEVLGRSSATNMHLRLGLTYSSGEGPASLFVKLPPLDPAHREAIGATGMGVREAQFYGEVAADCGLRVPRTWWTATADDGGFVLLLEDLAARGCRFSDGSWGVPADVAAGAMEDLARFHRQYETGRPAWADTPRRGSDFAVQAMRWVLDERGDVLTDDYKAVGELFVSSTAALEELWDRGPRTFIHGDPHVGNVFLDGDRVGFVDWGLAREGTALRDVSYFLTMACDASADEQRSLWEVYLGARGDGLSIDDAWQAHREQSGYTVIASFLGLTPTYDTAEGREFATLFRERSYKALEELDVVAALRTALS